MSVATTTVTSKQHIRGVYVSMSAAHEALYSQRGLQALPGDIGAGSTANNLKLWLECERDDSKSTATPLQALIALVIVPKDPIKYVVCLCPVYLSCDDGLWV